MIVIFLYVTFSRVLGPLPTPIWVLTSESLENACFLAQSSPLPASCVVSPGPPLAHVGNLLPPPLYPSGPCGSPPTFETTLSGLWFPPLLPHVGSPSHYNNIKYSLFSWILVPEETWRAATFASVLATLSKHLFLDLGNPHDCVAYSS